jgi:hypothetical protein
MRPEREKSRHYFLVSGGPIAVSIKGTQDRFRQTCVFTSGGIRGLRSAFQCVRGVKCRHTIFHARVGLVRFPYKVCWDTLHRTCVFTSGGICGSVVHSVAFGGQNVDALFFMLGLDR